MARRILSRNARDFNVWPGFTDVMVALLLIFIFVVTIFTITETILSRSLSKKDTELDRLNQEILRTTKELDRFKGEASKLAELFEAEQTKSGSLQQLVEQLRREVESAAARLLEKMQLLSDRDAEFQSTAKQLSDQKIKAEKAQEALEGHKEELVKLLAALKSKSELLGTSEKKLADMNVQLDEAQGKSRIAQEEASEKASRIAILTSEIAALNKAIAVLNERVQTYLDQISRLNRMLAEASESKQKEKTKAALLQKEIVSLRSQLGDLSAKLAETKESPENQFRIGQLVNLLGQKDKEIDKLRRLARYRSEFLSKLEMVFEGIPDIKVQGDRFIFQAEILFASGKEVVNENGKQQLDKFLKIYKEMVEKIPQDVALVILVQGHTDAVPITKGKYRSNWELASARSLQVVRYLVAGGIPPNRVAAASFGEFQPIDSRDLPDAHKVNRRIELKITSF
jgi:chemotaxis protein MotB